MTKGKEFDATGKLMRRKHDTQRSIRTSNQVRMR